MFGRHAPVVFTAANAPPSLAADAGSVGRTSRCCSGSRTGSSTTSATGPCSGPQRHGSGPAGFVQLHGVAAESPLGRPQM